MKKDFLTFFKKMGFEIMYAEKIFNIHSDTLTEMVLFQRANGLLLYAQFRQDSSIAMADLHGDIYSSAKIIDPYIIIGSDARLDSPAKNIQAIRIDVSINFENIYNFIMENYVFSNKWKNPGMESLRWSFCIKLSDYYRDLYLETSEIEADDDPHIIHKDYTNGYKH